MSINLLNYQLLEQSVVNRLNPLTNNGTIVIPLPETQDEMVKPFKDSKITVLYKSSDYDDTVTRGLPSLMSSDIVAQWEYAEIELVIQSRLLRGATGAHYLKRAIDVLLIGFEPEGWHKMVPKQYQLIPNQQDVVDGVWTFSYIWVTKNISVEASEEETVALFSSDSFTFNSTVETSC